VIEWLITETVYRHHVLILALLTLSTSSVSAEMEPETVNSMLYFYCENVIFSVGHTDGMTGCGLTEVTTDTTDRN